VIKNEIKFRNAKFIDAELKNQLSTKPLKFVVAVLKKLNQHGMIRMMRRSGAMNP
jgi:hypothetical protein